jgi:hypothetical protein
LQLPEKPVLPIGHEEETVSQLNRTEESYYTPTGSAVGGIPEPVIIVVILSLTAIALLELITLTGRKKGSGKGGVFREAGKPKARRQTETERLLAIKQAISEASK